MPLHPRADLPALVLGLVLTLVLPACTAPTDPAVQPDDAAIEIPPLLPDVSASPSPSPSPTPTPEPTPLDMSTLLPPSGVLIGAWVDPNRDSRAAGRELARDSLELTLGRPLDIDHLYYRWDAAFPGERERVDVRAGRIPLISWGRWYAAQITAGSYDAFISERARALRDLGGPVLLRWFWDMDLPDQATFRRDPAEYVAAWRHIVDLFRAAGATNVLFVWSPSAGGAAASSTFYPGDGYVDWIGASGYDLTGATSFRDLFAPFYATWSAQGKPLMIAETATIEGPDGYKARWFDALGQTLRSEYTAIRALVYWDSIWEPRPQERLDVRLGSTDASLAAFRRLARDTHFDPRAPLRAPRPSPSATLPPLVPIDPTPTPDLTTPAPETTPEPTPLPTMPPPTSTPIADPTP